MWHLIKKSNHCTLRFLATEYNYTDLKFTCEIGWSPSACAIKKNDVVLPIEPICI